MGEAVSVSGEGTDVWEISVPSAYYCCESKTAPQRLGGWCKPVIPALFEADHLRSGVRDQDGQHGGTRSLPKYKISQAW